MDYNYGLRKIYTKEEIDKARLSPGFGREYELQYLGKIGNVFNSLQIDKAIELGEQYLWIKYQLMITRFIVSVLMLDLVVRIRP